MNRYLIASILSLVLYFSAPESIDTPYCIMLTLIFLFQAISILSSDIKEEGILCFNLLFLFSFFWVTYAFPIFILGTPLDVRDGIERIIDFNLAPKCTALCTFAISVYFYAYKRNRSEKFKLPNWVESTQLSTIKMLYLISFAVLFIISLQYLRSVGGISVGAGYWHTIFMAIIPLVLVVGASAYYYSNIYSFVFGNKLIFISLILIMGLYFIIGDRGLIIISGIAILTVTHILVKRIKPVVLVSVMLIGASLMFVVRETRNVETGTEINSVENAQSILVGTDVVTLFSDLTGIHRELYLGYEYYKNYGLLYPKQIFIVPFYPLPLVPSVMSHSMFGKEMMDIKPNTILNEYVAYSGHGHLGIHCVIDIFMRWGIIGVFFFFYFFGALVARIRNSKNQNLLGTALYIIFIAYAIRIPRAPMLDMLRTIFYVLFMAWIAYRLSVNRRNL